MVLAIIGDFLLGYGTIGTTSDPDAYMGISWNVAPDWRYAVSSILGFLCAAMFAYAATSIVSRFSGLRFVCALTLTDKKR